MVFCKYWTLLAHLADAQCWEEMSPAYLNLGRFLVNVWVGDVGWSDILWSNKKTRHVPDLKSPRIIHIPDFWSSSISLFISIGGDSHLIGGNSHLIGVNSHLISDSNVSQDTKFSPGSTETWSTWQTYAEVSSDAIKSASFRVFNSSLILLL